MSVACATLPIHWQIEQFSLQFYLLWLEAISECFKSSFAVFGRTPSPTPISCWPLLTNLLKQENATLRKSTGQSELGRGQGVKVVFVLPTVGTNRWWIGLLSGESVSWGGSVHAVKWGYLVLSLLAVAAVIGNAGLWAGYRLLSLLVLGNTWIMSAGDFRLHIPAQLHTAGSPRLQRPND